MKHPIQCPCGHEIYPTAHTTVIKCAKCGTVWERIPILNAWKVIRQEHSFVHATCHINEDNKYTIEQATYKKAAIATVKKLAQVMCGPAYEFERTLSEYKEYLIRTYHLENEFPEGQSED